MQARKSLKFPSPLAGEFERRRVSVGEPDSLHFVLPASGQRFLPYLQPLARVEEDTSPPSLEQILSLASLTTLLLLEVQSAQSNRQVLQRSFALYLRMHLAAALSKWPTLAESQMKWSSFCISSPSPLYTMEDRQRVFRSKVEPKSRFKGAASSQDPGMHPLH
jgi:hypothetical protein